MKKYPGKTSILVLVLVVAAADAQACGEIMLRTATGQATIRAEGEQRLAQAVARVREWQPDALVVGVPFHPDGASHENTLRARKFARQLRGRCGKPVYEGLSDDETSSLDDYDTDSITPGERIEAVAPVAGAEPIERRYDDMT